AGVPVVKMSGRGLGHTGGTVDKLEAIPRFSSILSPDALLRAVDRVGLVLVAQMENLVPADEKLYALRDLTGTVDSLPLIASSVMSKKLAAGADAIVLDVKAGAGALLQTDQEATELASLMVDIGRGAGKQVVAVVTAMDQPLGWAVGNSLEVAEAIATLRGRGPSDLEEIVMVLGSHMLVLGGAAADLREAETKLRRLLSCGAGLEKFRQLVENQGGDPRVVQEPALLPSSAETVIVSATRGGYVTRVDARAIGSAAMALGAGREARGSAIDHAAGIVLRKKVGDEVGEEEPLAVMHFNSDRVTDVPAVARDVRGAFSIGGERVISPGLVRGIVTGSGAT
ncbi:MAG: thymidine phosphorylase, partial [Bacillota bacterium]